MKKIKNLVCILGVGTVLAACSYFETGGPEVATAQPLEKVDLMAGQEIEAQPLAPVEYKDVADVIRNSSDGRVEIFPLEGDPFSYDESFPGSSEPIEVTPLSAIPVGGEPGGMSLYPGVEVFPLDDAMDMQMRAHRGGTLDAPISLTPFPDNGKIGGRDAGRGSDFVAVGLPDGSPAVVYFAHDSTALNPEGLAQVSSLARNYGAGGGRDISVAGHASVQSSVDDPVQRKIINLKISMDRAFAVARALIESGIPPERIETRGYGEVRPAPLSDKPVEVASRRVEIFGVSVQ